MALGRSGHNVVYEEMGESKYSSHKKGYHMMPDGSMMKGKKHEGILDEHMARGRKMRQRRTM